MKDVEKSAGSGHHGEAMERPGWWAGTLMDTSGPEPRKSKQAGEELLSSLLKWRGAGGVVANSGGGFHHQWGSAMTSSESRVAKNSHFRFQRSEEEPFLREGGGDKSLEVPKGGGPKGPQLLVATDGQTPLSKAWLQPCPGVQAGKLLRARLSGSGPHEFSQR